MRIFVIICVQEVCFCRPLEECPMTANNNSILKIVNLKWRYNNNKMLIRPIYLTAINTRPACLSFNFLLTFWYTQLGHPQSVPSRYTHRTKRRLRWFFFFWIIIIYPAVRMRTYNLLVWRGRVFWFLLYAGTYLVVNRNFFFLPRPIRCIYYG